VILALALLVCLQATLFSRTSPVSYAQNSDGPGPAFTSETVTYSLPGKYPSIGKVDFRNLRPLKNGRYRDDKVGVHYSEELNGVYYLGGPMSNRQAAFWFSIRGSA